MKKEYQLIRQWPDHLEKMLFEGINQEAAQARGLPPIASFGLCIEDQEHRTLGGATGTTIYGCLYVDMLWIDKLLRKQGWGTRLMQEAEKIGREKHCTFAAVNTMDWEALPFYQKLGYSIEFTREGFENNSKMFLLRKELINKPK